MKLTREERAARRASFRKMSAVDKADYLYTYYKLPIALGLLALGLLCSGIYRQITKKDAVLYCGYLNVSVGEDLEARLDGGFISSIGGNPRKAEVYPYHGIYLSDNPTMENHEYAYASKLKMMAAIEAKQLDVVLMNREAYDVFSQNGYLLDLPGFLSQDSSLYALLEPCLTTNTVILEDNAIEYNLNEADRYVAVTEEHTNALDVSALPLFRDAGFPDTVYVGVVGNSPRMSGVLRYLEYLAAPPGTENPEAD